MPRPELVGEHRRRLLDRLIEVWDGVAEGGGAAVVLIEGEAGIGKTRLLQELYEVLVDSDDQEYWKPGLVPTGALRGRTALRSERKRIDPSDLFDGTATPSFLWLALSCVRRQSGQPVDDVNAGLVPELERHLEHMQGRRTRLQRLWKEYGGKGEVAVKTVQGALKQLPVLGSFLAEGVGWLYDANTWSRDLVSGLKRANQSFSDPDISERIETRRQQLFFESFDAFTSVSPPLPSVLVVDDAHLASPGTLRLLAKLVGSDQPTPSADQYFHPEAETSPRNVVVVLTYWPGPAQTGELGRWLGELETTEVRRVFIGEEGDDAEGSLRYLTWDETRAGLGARLPGLPEDRIDLLATHACRLRGDAANPLTVSLIAAAVAETFPATTSAESTSAFDGLDTGWVESLPTYPRQDLEARFAELAAIDNEVCTGEQIQLAVKLGAQVGTWFPTTAVAGALEPHDGDTWGGCLTLACDPGSYLRRTACPPWLQGSECWEYDDAESYAFALETGQSELPARFVTGALASVLETSLAWRQDDLRAPVSHTALLEDLRPIAERYLAADPGDHDLTMYAHSVLVEEQALANLAEPATSRWGALSGSASLERLKDAEGPSLAAVAARYVYTIWSSYTDPAEAIPLLTRVREDLTESAPDSRMRLVLSLRLANILRARSDLDGALGALEGVDDPVAVSQAASIVEQRGDMDAARAILRTWADRDSRVAVKLANLLEASGDRAAAEQVLADSPGGREVAMRLSSMMAKRDGEQQAAIELLVPYLSDSVDAAMAYARLLAEEDPDRAAQALERFAPVNSHAAIMIADVLGTDDFEAAYAALEPHAEVDADAAVRMSRLLEAEGRDGATDVVRPFIERYVDAALRYAELVAPDDTQLAVDALRPHAAANWQAAFRLSQIWEEVGEPGKAFEALERWKGEVPIVAHRYAALGVESGELSIAQSIDVVTPFACSHDGCARHLVWAALHQDIPAVRSGGSEVVRTATLVHDGEVFSQVLVRGDVRGVIGRNGANIGRVRDRFGCNAYISVIAYSSSPEDLIRRTLGLEADDRVRDLGEEWLVEVHADRMGRALGRGASTLRNAQALIGEIRLIKSEPREE